uniref:Uncharacterized protein n=1 Tax=Fibrocapsa japonica TaxID=94617 RepID=A0A6U1PJ94_9STRA|mmetsp:Transcript_4652/g.6948  ORF Transcript_4652/g.6948 Transcript_4652/m.6948 type:complete len:291 (+) Transcript_4652:74-946(+)|eukprot:CAMPEP_0113942152 /NCGR_PEP_ID=MMETSP1339-20121228/7916_1 /TAXON_ID=94617 /ORGANISM="Fibrocapsa japonica" /LENGTH=290 /DNA_ID=CAMNT_0000946509 /DNA_START=109 /DNA_END=981 /DNA_ORIENTATION=+ /assembly_acc=CAM_ASM_000762
MERTPYTTPGAGSYDINDSALRTKTTAPSFSFGSQKDRLVDLETKYEKKQHRPGPGAYGTASSCGRQIISNRVSSPGYSFGTSKREDAVKAYVSKMDSGPGVDMNAHGAGRFTPGPGTYEAVSPLRTKKEAPSYSFGLKTQNIRETHPNTTDVVGPGTYDNKSALGNQSLSYRASSPGYSMGSATRDGCHLAIQPGFQPQPKMQTPGPGEYGTVSCVNKQQVLSNCKTPFSCGFGKGEKSPSRVKRGVPGPGAYTPPSSFNRQPRSTQRTAPAFGFGTSKRPGINAGMVG